MVCNFNECYEVLLFYCKSVYFDVCKSKLHMECKQARCWWPAILWKNILRVFLWWSSYAATPSSHVYYVVKTPGGYTMYLFWGDNSPVWCVLKHIFADYMCKLYSVWLLTSLASVHTWLVNSSFSWLTAFCVPQDLRGGAHAVVAMQNQYQNRVENVKLVWKTLFASMTGHKQVGNYHTSKFSDGL